MYQLCTCDEYNSVSIIKTSKTLDGLVDEAKKIVTQENTENALTVEEQKRNYVCVLPQFFRGKKLINNTLYAGKNGKGQHMMLVVKNNKPEEIRLTDDIKLKIRFFIGTMVSRKEKKLEYDLYAEDSAGNDINDINHQDLEGKTLVYIKKI